MPRSPSAAPGIAFSTRQTPDQRRPCTKFEPDPSIWAKKQYRSYGPPSDSRMMRRTCPSLQLSHGEVGVPAYSLGAWPTVPTHGRRRIVNVDIRDVITESGPAGYAVNSRLRRVGL